MLCLGDVCTTFPGNSSQRVEINGSCKDQLITTGFNSRYDKAQVFKAMSGVYAVIWLPMFFQNRIYMPVLALFMELVTNFFFLFDQWSGYICYFVTLDLSLRHIISHISILVCYIMTLLMMVLGLWAGVDMGGFMAKIAMGGSDLELKCLFYPCLIRLYSVIDLQ